MTLIQLIIRNFKNIKELILTPGGANVDILGENATGKTSVYDAFLWGLFGKDSQNKTDFEIKTLKPDGSPIHNLEHSVEIVLQLEDGKQLTLLKVYTEKWTKKKGSALASFSGHTTQHFIDGVPVQAKEYTQRIGSLMDEELFRLLTSSDYFNVQLHWQQRRDILIDLCGELTDGEVIQSDKTLFPLAKIIEHRSIEDHRKVLAAKRREINQELEKIPVRIDEVTRNMPRAGACDPAAVAKVIEGLESKVAEIRELVEATSDNDEIEIRKRIRALEEEAQQLKFEAQKEAMDKTQKLREVEQQRSISLMETENDLRKNEQKSGHNALEIQKLSKGLGDLREEYKTTKAKELPMAAAQEKVCPTCKQAIPAQQIQAANEKASEDFNAKKAAHLKAIQVEGKALKVTWEDLLFENETLTLEKEQLARAVGSYQRDLDGVRDQLMQLQKEQLEYHSEEYNHLLSQAHQLKTDKEARAAAQRSQRAAQTQELSDLQQAIRKETAKLQDIENAKAAKARIIELEEEEKGLLEEYEKLEQEMYLTEAFIRARVAHLEKRINSKFAMARFKMFHQQQNGGLAETCETTVAGVPYSSLNNAARINVGLDILNTLSRHYGKKAPVFIDNAEAVIELLPISSQTIRLVVSAAHRELTVKLSETEKESA